MVNIFTSYICTSYIFSLPLSFSFYLSLSLSRWKPSFSPSSANDSSKQSIIAMYEGHDHCSEEFRYWYKSGMCVSHYAAYLPWTLGVEPAVS